MSAPIIAPISTEAGPIEKVKYYVDFFWLPSLSWFHLVKAVSNDLSCVSGESWFNSSP
jgi:hypothetical protein